MTGKRRGYVFLRFPPGRRVAAGVTIGGEADVDRKEACPKTQALLAPRKRPAALREIELYQLIPVRAHQIPTPLVIAQIPTTAHR